MEIRLLSKLTGFVRFPEGKSDDDHHPDVTQIFVRVSPPAWVVESVDASEAGWEPFLYDIAMELATMHGCGLRSHESNTNEHARKIWEFYASKRDDVIRERLTSAAARPRDPGPLAYTYFKKSPDFIVQLKANDKWEEREREITELG